MITDDPAIERVRLLRNQGMERRYENELIGFNTRMTDLHAAIGRVQLAKLGGWTESRQRNAAYLDEHLAGVVVPPVADGAKHVYHQYTVRSDRRDELAQQLTDRGVGSGVYYPIPTHKLPSFDLDLDLPETARRRRGLVLAGAPVLSGNDLAAIVRAVNG